LFGICGADDLVLLVDGAGNFHGGGHDVQEVSWDTFF
jgi:hypothetical protein